jgi:hypothetical protein
LPVTIQAWVVDTVAVAIWCTADVLSAWPLDNGCPFTTVIIIVPETKVSIAIVLSAFEARLAVCIRIAVTIPFRTRVGRGAAFVTSSAR